MIVKLKVFLGGSQPCNRCTCSPWMPGQLQHHWRERVGVEASKAGLLVQSKV